MAAISNSSIQIWLDFNGDLPATIPTCQTIALTTENNPIVVSASCIDVCNDTELICDSRLTDSLAVCGLWSSLTTLQFANISQHRSSLEAFVPLGLDYSDAAYTNTARNSVALCLSSVYTDVVAGTYLGQGFLPTACTEQELFNSFYFQLLQFGQTTKQPLLDCVDAICAPATVNPNLGGIGVSVLDSLA